jgi:hypothetical protein
LWVGQAVLKQSWEQKGAGGRPNFMQLGHLRVEGFEHWRHVKAAAMVKTERGRTNERNFTDLAFREKSKERAAGDLRVLSSSGLVESTWRKKKGSETGTLSVLSSLSSLLPGNHFDPTLFDRLSSVACALKWWRCLHPWAM